MSYFPGKLLKFRLLPKILFPHCCSRLRGYVKRFTQALQGRKILAWGVNPRVIQRISSQPFKGGTKLFTTCPVEIYVALPGLVGGELLTLGFTPQAKIFRPGAFHTDSEARTTG